MSEFWVIYCYNEIDSEFGYECGAQIYKHGLEPAVAKSIVRHMNKISPWFISYWAEEEPRRYW